MKTPNAQIQQQYQHLKHKVQSQIQALQKKLSHNTEIHYHRTINSTNSANSKTLLQPSTSSEYQHNKQPLHQHSKHCHQSNCHNRSSHSGRSCCHSHCGQGRSRKSSASIQGDGTPGHSRTLHIPTANISTVLQPPAHHPVNVPLVNTKILQHNLFLQQAFIKSMYTQQQMAQNLRLLQDKIAKLQSHPPSKVKYSNNSQQISSQQCQFRSNSSGSENGRSRSLVNDKQNFRANMGRDECGYNVVLNEYSRDRWGNTDDVEQEHSNKQSKSKSKSKNGSNRNIKSSKSIKSNNNKSTKKANTTKHIPPSKHIKNQYLLSPNNHSTSQKKHQHRFLSPKMNTLHGYKSTSSKPFQPSLYKNQQWSDYYTADRLCPVHINPAEIRLKSKQKEVYIDSQHRNRKHQRDHLLQSFKQQDSARKKIIDKILKSTSAILAK